MNWNVREIFEELIQLDEHQRIEAKYASDIGYSIMQTICAFANEPGLGGGWLLLGIAEPDSEHSTHWVSGVDNIDKLLGELQNNCRTQFEHSIRIECKHEKFDGKSVIGVFVHELEPNAKPCRFIGKPDKHNKRKTGVWRRGANGDYECTEKELEPILIAKAGTSYEQIILPDTTLDDLDENAIALYRKLRAKVRPNAEELQADDLGLLRALRVVKKHGGEYIPNISGLLLFGKTLSLRRLLPAVRVDYVRVAGTEWVEDPEQRFQYSLDLREPLLTLIPKLENVILDDMPRYFRLEEGQLQRSDQPFLPQKVIREAIVNAVMHRDYHVHQLMNEEQLLWLKQFRDLNLSSDEAKALVLIREVGAIDNGALRAITDLDTLAASKVLGRLWQQYHLIEKGGSGRNTYYKPTHLLMSYHPPEHQNKDELNRNDSNLMANSNDLNRNSSDLDANSSHLPDALREEIERLTPKSRHIRPVILKLCLHHSYSADQMATILNRNASALKTKQLIPMCDEGLITYTHPEVRNHPNQAYAITEKGRQWLKNKGQL
ncbi:helix-turn-helix domain-containing protein [Legionella londiniensis]|uniref:ATP-dependent DNA helicase n=1 Tax=Legionella londiniensis TaxID=45068 RepID=A0A0W0VK46_9GAMM|nr:RNA-binding domain-containing protein [Legionella londiniensis]KTD20333.1 ATP-dependent DNA helicase [Legionella londiniensis]STX93935.1 ATP-dependent DNA helicase [Legionella londiniensis]